MANIFDNFKPSAPATSATPATPATPDASTDITPPPGSLGSYLPSWMTKPVATGSIADTARVAANTFGLGDRALAGGRTYGWWNYLNPGLSGTSAEQSKPSAEYDANLKAARAETEAASGRLGGAGNIIANAVGAAPLAALGVGGGVAEGLEALTGPGAAITRGVLGNVAEGVMSGGLAAAGHGDSVPLGMATGGATGLIGSPIAGAANWAARKVATPVGRLLGSLYTPSEVSTATKAVEQGAWADAKNITFNPSDVNDAYSRAFRSLDADQVRNLTPGMNKAFGDHMTGNLQMNSIDASNINGFSRDIISNARSNADSVLANRLKSNLDDVLQNARPISNPVALNPLDVVNNARTASQKSIMAQGLEDASTQLRNQYKSPGPWAQTQSEFYKPGTPQYEGLSGIVRASGGATAMPSGYGAAHMVEPAIEGALAAAGMPSAGLMTGAAMQGIKPTISGLINAAKRAGLQGRLADLYPSVTGRAVSAAPNIGRALFSTIYGSEAARGL
jgi:hypothetical protein